MSEGKLIPPIRMVVERLNEQLARVYAAEVTIALKNMHSLKIMHRDLKPENVLLD